MAITLFSGIHFHMTRDLPPTEAEIFNEKSDTYLPISDTLLDTIVHKYGNGNWSLDIEFDERALPSKFYKNYEKLYDSVREKCSGDRGVDYGNGEDVNEKHYCPNHGSEEYLDLTIHRREYFKPTATLRDVLARITNGKCYGYFEGFELIRPNCYKLNWGT